MLSILPYIKIASSKALPVFTLNHWDLSSEQDRTLIDTSKVPVSVVSRLKC